MGVEKGGKGYELRGGLCPCVVERRGGLGVEIGPERPIVIRVPAETIDEPIGATGEGVLGGEMDGIGKPTMSAHHNPISINRETQTRKSQSGGDGRGYSNICLVSASGNKMSGHLSGY